MTMMPANYLQAGVGLTPGGVVLDLRGEINSFAKEALNAACAEAKAKYPETILLNFEEINYINSTEAYLEASGRAEGVDRRGFPRCLRMR